MASVAPKTIGRGGAGNFMSKTDVQAAEIPSSPHTTTRTVASHLANARSGRGGAGNIAVSTAESVASYPDAEVVEALKRETTSRSNVGRGGVGNYYAGTEKVERLREQDVRKTKKELDERIRRAVDITLLPPPRVYRTAGAIDRELGEEYV